MIDGSVLVDSLHFLFVDSGGTPSQNGSSGLALDRVDDLSEFILLSRCMSDQRDISIHAHANALGDSVSSLNRRTDRGSTLWSNALDCLQVSLSIESLESELFVTCNTTKTKDCFPEHYPPRLCQDCKLLERVFESPLHPNWEKEMKNGWTRQYPSRIQAIFVSRYQLHPESGVFLAVFFLR